MRHTLPTIASSGVMSNRKPIAPQIATSILIPASNSPAPLPSGLRPRGRLLRHAAGAAYLLRPIQRARQITALEIPPFPATLLT